jgi:hypothetical protein
MTEAVVRWNRQITELYGYLTVWQRLWKNPIARFSDILRNVRRHAYEGPTKGEETHGAYCFYGNPFAHRARDEKSATSANASYDPSAAMAK